jgi:hypothetical protein
MIIPSVGIGTEVHGNTSLRYRKKSRNMESWAKSGMLDGCCGITVGHTDYIDVFFWLCVVGVSIGHPMILVRKLTHPLGVPGHQAGR